MDRGLCLHYLGGHLGRCQRGLPRRGCCGRGSRSLYAPARFGRCCCRLCYRSLPLEAPGRARESGPHRPGRADSHAISPPLVPQRVIQLERGQRPFFLIPVAPSRNSEGSGTLWSGAVRLQEAERPISGVLVDALCRNGTRRLRTSVVTRASSVKPSWARGIRGYLITRPRHGERGVAGGRGRLPVVLGHRQGTGPSVSGWRTVRGCRCRVRCRPATRGAVRCGVNRWSESRPGDPPLSQFASR
jgi:hypothetical protein